MTDYNVNPMDVALDDIDFDVFEDPETGATTYDKPEVEDEVVDNAENDEGEWSPEPDKVDVTSLLSELPEDAEVTIRGKKVKLGRIGELVEKEEAIEHNSAILNDSSQNLQLAYKHFNQLSVESKSEVQLQMEALLDAKARSTDPTERGTIDFKLEKLQLKKAQLEAKSQRAEELYNAGKQENLNHRISVTDNAMLQKYGNEWKASGKELYAWAQNVQGIPGAFLAEGLCPGLADALMKAAKFDRLAERQAQKRDEEIKGAIARSKSPRKTMYQEPSPVNSKAQEKVRGGKASMTDMAEAFDPSWF